MKKTTLSTAIGLIIGGASLSANAALTSTNTLSFTLGVATSTCAISGTPPGNCAYGIVDTDIAGSYFAMDTGGNGAWEPGEKQPISSFNGIHIGTTQAAGGSHAGLPDGTESPNIDNPWPFSSNTGMHQTTIAITQNGDGTMDFSGWNVTWNGIASIPLVATTPVTISCGLTCSTSSNYTLDGDFHVAGGGFNTVGYQLHLTGTVDHTVIPVPAAVWLFGSGLLGLAGVARRRKSA